MILKSHDIEIPEGNPYQNDALDRQESGEALTKFVLSANDSVVICIDAPWGQGKTTFLRMWEQNLKNKKIPTIYFNAWESDFSDDALVCLIGEVSASIKELSKTGDESRLHLVWHSATWFESRSILEQELKTPGESGQSRPHSCRESCHVDYLQFP